jgi:cell division septation protein DedD
MAGSRTAGGRRRRWVLGLAALAVPGFALGAISGLLFEEPGLVVSYVLGRTEAVSWGEGDEAGGHALPAVAAPGEAVATPPAAAPEATPVASPAPAEAPAPPPVKKPAVSPPLPTAASVAASTGFVIQVGAFGERAGAERLAADLRSKGYRVTLSEGDSGGARWRVRVGPSATREEADRIASRLKQSEKLPTWVLEEGG